MFKIIKKNDHIISRWSGGLSKQLYIYPETSSYQEKNFKFRLSIATTERENSIFTKLSNTQRVISVLNGTMELEHEGKYTIKLGKYEIDHFNGEWNTLSKGKATDFNLMIREGFGDFFFKKANENTSILFDCNSHFKFIFCINGKIKIQDHELYEEDLIVTDEEKIEMELFKQSKIFYGYINFHK